MVNFGKSFFKKDKLTERRVLVEQINDREEELEKLNDDLLRLKFSDLKKQYEQNQDLNEILVDVFALVREASRRTLGQRHFDVQLIGGIGLHSGMVVEMVTGEGKTLVATLPAVLNAIAGKVHIVTVNDYLAKRDAVWMGQIYNFFGLKVACLAHESSFIYDPNYAPKKEEKEVDQFGSFKVFYDFLRPVNRFEAYRADIIYATNYEIGFDYLRDHLALSLDQVVQTFDRTSGFDYAIIDEVDSILIDESRTPLIISGYEESQTPVYYFYDRLAKKMIEDEDFTIDQKRRAVYLTEAGQNLVEKEIGYNPYQIEDLKSIHHLEEALRANYLFKRDKDYIIKDNQVVIVDEFTGRLMFGRRWSGSLHQAVEAKEGTPIQPESKTVAEITIQNLFRKYKKLAGMTGTALTSAEEFYKVYQLETTAIPTNKPNQRIDRIDNIYLSEEVKWQAVVEKVRQLQNQGRPVLIGTTSIQRNEFLSRELKKAGVNHSVLNAKNNEEEGQVIAQAGRFGVVTVATNMAGRGVDIILGGNPSDPAEAEKIRTAGGLFVLGTDRHESRRIDNQLRGRTGRQGDPGETQFFISLDDEVIKIFGGERIKHLVERFNFPKDEPINNSLISKVIEEAQAKVEGLNFDLRKHLLDYDNVVNAQREKIYQDRQEILFEKINFDDFIKEAFANFLGEDQDLINFSLKIKPVQNDQNESELVDQISSVEADRNPGSDHDQEKKVFQEKLEQLKSALKDQWPAYLKLLILRVYDYLWSEHLSYISDLKESVGWRGYGQRDPLVEFKKEALVSFDNFHRLLRINLIQSFFQSEIKVEASKIGRNDPCPCGSGKKYKKCHGN
ncbi:MAG: preprotein translocase subunit SecA [Patescibacteria group bacterium]|nr:preprotein translocase subunit SecA [Patescibacteria group bacterium]MCL5257849.1 preprotein translocase subunit SecA [Patescibacteria group bacterium]